MDILKTYSRVREGRVIKRRMTDDELREIIKRVKSSRSIQWWKEDILQLCYEIIQLKKELEQKNDH